MTATRRARDVVERLLAAGVREAVIAPGSRSGPLALVLFAADEAGALRLHVRIDEREAGFLALGLAKASARPVPVVTTSGTAVANLHPALLEALHSGVSLWAITADRPGRLRGTGANQTTDQRGIFGHVRHVEHERDLRPHTGPAHLNVEFDEPLVEPGLWRLPLVISSVDEDERATSVVHEVEAGGRTVVVAGDGAGGDARRVAEEGGWPLLAEPSSGARSGTHALTAYRTLLDHTRLSADIVRVLSFGHPTLSRQVTSLLGRADVEVVHVGGAETFPHPVDERVSLVGALAVQSGGQDTGRAGSKWLDRWREADRLAVAAIDAVLPPDAPHRAAAAVWNAIPREGLLVVGSSNPVRDLDLMAQPDAAGFPVLANRGLAGIDGMVSTAVGAALHRCAPAIALMGDLTFLHGANGLLIGPFEPRPDLTLVVVSDDGGSIFGTLEQADPAYADAFERVYATPTGTRIGHVCAAHGVPHRTVRPSGLAGLLAASRDSPATRGISVIEVPVARDDRRALADRISDAVGDTCP